MIADPIELEHGDLALRADGAADRDDGGGREDEGERELLDESHAGLEP